MYRSIAHGLQQLAAIATGTVVATAFALALNSTLLAMAVVLPAAVLLGNWRRLDSQGIYAATGALFVLTGPSVGVLTSAARIGEAVFGALVGIAVNVLIRPPVYLRSPRAALEDAADEARSVMEDVAEGLDGGEWDAAEQKRLARARPPPQPPRRPGPLRPRVEPGEPARQPAPPLPYRRRAGQCVRRRRRRLRLRRRPHRRMSPAPSWRPWARTAKPPGPAPRSAGPYAAFLRRAADAVRLYGAVRFDDGSAAELDEAVAAAPLLDELRRRIARRGHRRPRGPRHVRHPAHPGPPPRRPARARGT